MEKHTKADVVAALQRRLGERANADKLTSDYLAGVEQFARARTIGGGSAPTSLAVERADLVIAVCREHGSMLTDREIEALLRVTPAQSRAILRLVEAAYDDEVSTYLLAAALRGARTNDTGEFGHVDGNRIVLRDGEAREQFLKQCDRLGIPAIANDTDADKPFLVYIDRRLDLRPFKLPKWGNA